MNGCRCVNFIFFRVVDIFLKELSLTKRARNGALFQAGTFGFCGGHPKMNRLYYSMHAQTLL